MPLGDLYGQSPCSPGLSFKCFFSLSALYLLSGCCKLGECDVDAHIVLAGVSFAFFAPVIGAEGANSALIGGRAGL